MNLVRRFLIFFCDYYIKSNNSIFSRGYYPKGGGEVRITVNPVNQLTAVDLSEFGQIKRFFGRAFVAGTLSKRV